MKKVKEQLPETEILAQLAEEAVELAHAALKLRRAMDGTNPTPVTEKDARNALIEEYGDVMCCICSVLTIGEMDVATMYAKIKANRWEWRLENRGKNGIE